MKHEYFCEVGFAETDAGGRAHFAQYFVYVERAEHDFLRKIGVPVFEENEIGWPRARVDCEYKRPLFFGDCITVCLEIAKVGKSSITWKFQIRVDEELAASGEMVCVHVDGAGKPAELKQDFRVKLGVGE